MPIQYINTGSSANAGNGDSIRLAFDKVNRNFKFVDTRIDALSNGFLNSLHIATTASIHNLTVTGTTHLNTVESATFLNQTYFENITVSNTSTLNLVTANDAKIDTLEVLTSLSVGSYQIAAINDYNDFSIIKNDATGLAVVLLNTNADSNSKLIVKDNISGGLAILHQNLTNLAGDFVPGENYIYGETPTDVIHIGAYSDIKFSASEAKYYDPSLPETPSMVIQSIDGAVHVYSSATFHSDVYGITGVGTLDRLTSQDLSKVVTLNNNGSLVPSADLTYDLGSTSSQWRSLYVGTSTIYLGGTALSVAGNTLTIDGSPIQAGGTSLGSLVNGANTVSLDNGGLDLTFTSGEKIKTLLGGGIELYRSGDNTIGIYNSRAEINTFATGGAKHSWTFGTNGTTTFPNNSIKNSLDNSTAIITQRTLTANNTYTNVTDFSTDVDLGGGMGVIAGWYQRNASQIEFALFGDSTFQSYLTGLALGRTVIVTYNTASVTATLTGTVTQAFTQQGQSDPNNPTWGRVSGRIDATLPAGQLGIVSINFPVYSTSTNDWTFGTTGALTFPDTTVQTTAYPGVLVPANGDNVSGVANLVFYAGTDWYNTSKVGINPANGFLTIAGTGGAGGIILPNSATIDNTPEIITVTLDQFTDGGFPGTQVFTKVSDTLYELSPGGPYMTLISGIWRLKVSTATYYDSTDLETWGTVAGGLPAPVGTLGTVASMNLTVNSNTWAFAGDGSTTLPIGVSIDQDNGTYYPRIIADTGKAFSLQGQGSTGSAAIAWFETESTSSQYAAVGVSKGGGEGLANVVLIAGSSTPELKVWRFDETGTTTFPDGTTSTGAVIRAAQSSSYIIQTLGSAEASPSNVLSIFEFGVDGTLTLPEGGVISEGGGLTGAIRLTPAGGANAYQSLVIYPTAAAPDGDHLHLTAGGGTTELYLGNDYHYVKLVDGGNVEVQASTGTYSNGVLSASAWTFGTDGRLVNVDGLTLTAGGQFNICTIVSVGSGYDTGSALKATTGGSGTGMTVGIGYGLIGQLSNVTVVDPGTGYVDGDVITVSEGTGGTFTITRYNDQANQANNNFVQSNWTFGTDGALTFPDSTAQTTAHIQGEQIFTVNTGTTAYTPTAVDFNLLFVTAAVGYSETDPISVTLTNGVPGQRLVIFNGYNLATLTVNPGFFGRDIYSGVVAEFIYSGYDGLWMPLYGTNSPT